MKSPDDLRRFQRAPIKMKVSYGPITPSFSGMISTIGMGGAFIESERVFPEGAELVFLFSMPGYSNPITARGLVAYVLKRGFERGKCKGPGMGVRFTDISDEDQKAIHDYVVGKYRVLRELKHLLSLDPPPMKRINELLTSTYIMDYTSLSDLRAKVDRELSILRLTKD